MTALPLIDVIGFWIGIFLTLCVLSFLYKDNPFYKLAEHLFVGVSLGYVIVQQYEDNLKPKLVDPIGGMLDHGVQSNSQLVVFIPIALTCMLLVRAVSRRWAWLGRYPMAFVVALFAGTQINAVAQADLGAQIKFSAKSLDSEKVDLNTAPEKAITSLPGMSAGIATKVVAERALRPFTSVDDMVSRPSLTGSERATLESMRVPLLGHLVGLDARAAVAKGQTDWFGVVSNVILLLGLLASLLYFYFSLAHKGVVGKISRFGVWILMIGFGASFGFTVQGRIALAIGRAQDIRGTFMHQADAGQIQGPLVAVISALIIIAGIVLWERWAKRRDGGTGEVATS